MRNEFNITSQVSAKPGIEIFSGETYCKVERNDFTGRGVGIWMDGQSQVDVLENEFENSDFGVMSEQTGKGSVNINCNNFPWENTTVPIYILGGNDNAVVVKNYFAADFSNIVLESWQNTTASIAPMQGGPGAPARNCFNTGVSNSIWALDGNSSPFEYFLGFNAPACEVPQNPAGNNYSVVQTDYSTEDGCYLFGRKEGYVPFGDVEDYLYLKNVIDSIGAIPADLLTMEAKFELLNLKYTKEQEIKRLIAGAIDSANIGFVDSILVLENTARSKRQRFGLRLQLQDYTGAQAILQTLPSGPLNDEDAQFRIIQTINLARLTTTGAAFELTPEQGEALEYIANQKSTERAYARSLLVLLKQRQYWPTIDLSGNESMLTGSSDGLMEEQVPEEDLNIYPNPTNGALTIEYPEQLYESATIYLYNSVGKVCKSSSFDGAGSVNIDLSDMPRGFYFVELRAGSAILGKAKVLLQD